MQRRNDTKDEIIKNLEKLVKIQGEIIEGLEKQVGQPKFVPCYPYTWPYYWYTVPNTPVVGGTITIDWATNSNTLNDGHTLTVDSSNVQTTGFLQITE
jgi:hypothetical protein